MLWPREILLRSTTIYWLLYVPEIEKSMFSLSHLTDDWDRHPHSEDFEELVIVIGGSFITMEWYYFASRDHCLNSLCLHSQDCLGREVWIFCPAISVTRTLAMDPSGPRGNTVGSPWIWLTQGRSDCDLVHTLFFFVVFLEKFLRFFSDGRCLCDMYYPHEH